MNISTEGLILLAATPIGDVEDAPPRLRRALADADLIAAEDTRRLLNLAGRLGVPLTSPVVSLYEHNEAERAGELIAAAQQGKFVLVVSDAGVPTVSDPGFRLVRAAIDAGVRVSAVPGPSAALTALSVSGIASDRFCFEGFLPRRPGERRSRLAELAGEPRTLVFFEAPHRLAAALADLAAAFGADRPAAVCRELTKTYEEVRRAPLAELAAWAAGGVRGEVTLVVAGAPAAPLTTDTATLAAEVAEREAAGEPRREAIAAVARALGVPKRLVFDAVVAGKRTSKPG